MLQLTRKGLVLHGQLDVLRERFFTNHCVVLEKLLEPALLKKVQEGIEQAPWRTTTHVDDVGTELTLDDPVTIHILLFLLNRPEFLDAIRIITGCAEINYFHGRVYRLAAGPQSQLSWHDDIDPAADRLVATAELQVVVECVGEQERLGGSGCLRAHANKRAHRDRGRGG